ncbi:hypothetical protein KC953_03445 [Candidatus Saccharibacteria bacterium]|nr:hypothetical protein [Candidatus Saccharibacteria bacterium]
MTNAQARQTFMESEKGRSLREQLEMMVESPLYNTHAFSLNGDPEGAVFVNKHMHYMSSHRSMNHSQYLSNLKLMTKIR